MHERVAPARVFIAAVIAGVSMCGLLAAGCGGSGNTVVSPSSVSKCAVAFEAPSTTLSASGGTGSIPISTERECQWSAQSDAAWLTIPSGSSGQGEGLVQFAAAANPDPVVRTGGITVNTRRAQISQAAAECTYSLAENSASFATAGGSGSVGVRASSALCTWTATSDADWITITSGASGRGSAPVAFAVAPTSGPPRTGSLKIAGLSFSVTQSEGCAFAIAPATFASGAAGGAGTVAVTAGAGCPWSAASNAAWISVGTTSGSGSGTVPFTVAPTSGPSRTGTVTVAGQVFTVTQSPGCSFDVSPVNLAAGAAGGPLEVKVGAASGCGWTATSSASWITIASGASGSGSGSVAVTVEATAGPSRTGTLTVAGQTVTVVQGQGCSFAIAPETQAVPASGATGAVAVTAASGCAWTAASNDPWITIASGASGNGNGTVNFTVAATTGPSRSGTLTIAGRTFTINQGQGCTFSLSPASASSPASGGAGAFDVRTAGGCAWSASSSASWLAITAGATGNGNGTVRYTAAANTGPQRSGVITAGGQAFTVTQASGCTIAIAPSSTTVPAGGGSGSFNVTAGATCAWSAAATASWIGITSGAAGTGPGTVQFTAAANTGPSRSGTITVGGQAFTISQDAGCVATVTPDTIAAPAAGAAPTVGVSTADGCGWTAAANAAWIRIQGTASGAGNGSVQLGIDANTGAARTGTATIAGRTVTVNQDSGCSFAIAPTATAVVAAGGGGSIAVTAGDGCAWTAVSGVPWITVTSGASGAGNGTVQFTVDVNATGAARSGTITVAGQAFTVDQSGT